MSRRSSFSPPQLLSKNLRMSQTEQQNMDSDSFDWQSYISNYTGRTQITRLIFIASHTSSASLRKATSQAALELISSTTQDTAAYTNAVNVRNTLPDGKTRLSQQDSFKPNQGWVDSTNEKNRSENEKLDLELRNYQNNLMKESIRMGNRYLGDHFRRSGDFQNAHQCYTRTRDYCSTPEHVMDMCLNVVHVSLELGNHGAVSTFVSKAEGVLESYNPAAAAASGKASATSSANAPSKTGSGADAIGALFRAGGSSAASAPVPNLAGPSVGAVPKTAEARGKKEIADIKARLQVAGALAALGQEKYSTAANFFLACDPTNSSAYSHIISPGDIALYTVLTSLATKSREDIKSQVLDSAALRSSGEHEPHARDIMDAFWQCRYRKGMDLLEKFKERHLLDLHLRPHLASLTAQLTRRSMQSFLIPFDRISFVRMGEAFGWEQTHVGEEVIKLIQKREVDARVDWVNKMIISNSKDVRTEMYRGAIKNGERRNQDTKKLLMRMKLVENGLIVKAPKEQRA